MALRMYCMMNVCYINEDISFVCMKVMIDDVYECQC